MPNMSNKMLKGVTRQEIEIPVKKEYRYTTSDGTVYDNLLAANHHQHSLNNPEVDIPFGDNGELTLKSLLEFVQGLVDQYGGSTQVGVGDYTWQLVGVGPPKPVKQSKKKKGK